MADRTLRNLSRRELIEIIYTLQQKEAEQQKKIELLEQKLSGRLVVLENAGSIADAVVGLNELFAVAQRTADDYIESVRLAQKAFAMEAQQESQSQEEPGPEEEPQPQESVLEEEPLQQEPVSTEELPTAQQTPPDKSDNP